MSKGIVTDYPEICFICGRPSEAEHHLVFGTAGRELSEKDGLKVPVCNNCHNMGEILMRIHGNPMAERMSKIILANSSAFCKAYSFSQASCPIIFDILSAIGFPCILIRISPIL